MDPLCVDYFLFSSLYRSRARMTTWGEFDQVLKAAEQDGGPTYIEVVMIL
jgi:hypothetical protein